MMRVTLLRFIIDFSISKQLGIPLGLSCANMIEIYKYMDLFSILVLISSFYACLSILKIIFFFRPSLFMGIQHCLCLLDLSLHLFNVIFEKKSRCRYLSIRFFTFMGIHRLEKIRHMTKCLLTAESFELRKRVNLAVCRPRLT